MIKKIDSSQDLSIQEWIRIIGKKQAEIIDYLNDDSQFIATAYSSPTLGIPYHYISSKGKCEKKMWDNSDNDRKRKELGNCFQTREEAHEAKMKIKEALK